MSDIDWMEYTESLKAQLSDAINRLVESEREVEDLKIQIASLQSDNNDLANWETKAIKERDRAIAIADGMMAWESLADTRKSMKDLAALKSEIGKTDCPKCKGTGWYMYSHEHSTICDACCKHEEGWWDLTEHYSGYKKDADNGCCRKGCGTLRRDLIK